MCHVKNVFLAWFIIYFFAITRVGRKYFIVWVSGKINLIDGEWLTYYVTNGNAETTNINSDNAEIINDGVGVKWKKEIY